MKDKWFESLRKSIWELQCSLGEWNGDPDSAIDYAPVNIPKRVDSILSEICFQELDQKQKEAVFELMISALKYVITAQRLEKERLESECDFAKKRDEVAKLIPFTEEENDRWAGQ